jgi:hypothetical protein
MAVEDYDQNYKYGTTEDGRNVWVNKKTGRVNEASHNILDNYIGKDITDEVIIIKEK